METKGYDAFNEIGTSEKLKIASAKAFFEELKKQGVNVEYKTKLNSPDLSQLISDILL